MSGDDPLGARDRMHGQVRAVQAGDADALDRWYRDQYPIVWRLCVGFLTDAAEADDLAQDAVLKLLDQHHRWDGRRPYRAWRNALVLNLCRDRRRRRAARRGAEERAAETKLPGELPDPLDAVAQSELRHCIVEALGALTEREREAFVLVELEGLPTREASEVLGVQPASVRSLTTLARRRLRNLLGPRLHGFAPGTSGGDA